MGTLTDHIRQLACKILNMAEFSPTVFMNIKDLAKAALPYMCLLVFCILGALLAYVADLPDHSSHANATCVKQNGYLGAILYVTTVYTTIGYGIIVPCNAWSKLLTIALAFTGIPIFLAVLHSFGKITGKTVNVVYLTIRRWWRTSRYSTPGSRTKDANSDADEKYECVPIQLSIVLTLSWCLISAQYFCWLEGWSYLDSVYFTFINLSTMGFGGNAPSRRNLMPLFFGILLLAFGMSLLSMTLNILQLNVRNLMKRLHLDIEREFQQKLQQEAEHPYLARSEQVETPEEVVARLIKQKGAGFLATVMSRDQLDLVICEAAKRVSLQNAVVQTEPLSPLNPLRPWTLDRGAQTEFQAVHDREVQYETKVMSSQAVQSESMKSSSCSQTDSQNLFVGNAKDEAVSVRPRQRTVLLQTPTWGFGRDTLRRDSQLSDAESIASACTDEADLLLVTPSRRRTSTSSFLTPPLLPARTGSFRRASQRP